MVDWVVVETGHEIGIVDGEIVARNNNRQLKSVPAKVKKTEAYEQLDSLLNLLHTHDLEAGQEVERWLLRSLPVARELIVAVWADEAWRSWLHDLVIATDDGVAGFLRDAAADGLGIVDLDGETDVVTADQVRIPHPALLEDLDDLREFAAELGIRQRLDQLFREVNPRPEPAPDASVTSLRDWAGGEFEELRFATARAVSLGFRISGGYATTMIHEGDRQLVARYWLGAEYPEAPAVTEDLHWILDGEMVPVGEAGPVAYSEGVRMAKLIYAGRKVEEKK